VVNTFIKDALLRERLFLHGGGWMWRPLVDVTDVAEAHLRCLEAPASAVGGHIFNVVHENYQIRQLAMLVAGSLSLHHRPVRLENAPVPKINRNDRCTNRKLQDAIGFTPRVTVLESIERILSFLPIDDPVGLAHPRYYNIDWMTLIDEVVDVQSPFATVWGTQRRAPENARSM
jgi:nucleoside-diphosphate-sugar epimerase